MAISFDDLIPTQSKAASLNFDDLIPAAPPQGKVSAPPTAVDKSEPAGGEAAGSVLNGGAAFGVYPNAMPRRNVAPTVPTNILKPGEPGYSVLGDMPKPSPLPVGVNPDFVNQTRAEMLRATPEQRMSLLNGGGMKANVVKSLLETEPKTFAAPRSGVMRNTDAATAMGMDIRQAVPNPAARAVIGGLTGLGQVLPGVVQAGADLVGADDLASKAGQVAGFGRDMADPLRPSAGNDKIVYDIFNSIIQSAPTLLTGLAGGAPMKLLFAQTGAQEYSEGRSKGLSGVEAATRAGTLAGAEVLGERLGLTQQLKILRGLTQGMPTNELAPTLAKMIVREVPGEQLTTGLQFLGDKYGVGALNPQATLEQYLKAAGDTLVTTVGQAGIMGGGPTLIRAGINETRRQEAGQLAGATDAIPEPTALARAEREQPAPSTPAPAPGPLPVDQRIKPTLTFDDLIPGAPVDAPAPVVATAPASAQPPAPAPAEPVSTLQSLQGAPNELRQEGQEAAQAVAPGEPVTMRRASASIPAGLTSIGYKLLQRGDERRFKGYGTWEKDGVRMALSGDLLMAERGTVQKYESDGDAMTIEAVITDADARNQGRARKAMQDVIRFADEVGKDLYLEPVSLEKESGLNREQLVQFYKSIGFEPTDSSGLVMARKAKPANDTQRVSTVTGRQVETRMRVVDASELQAATGDMQPRDRTRASSDEQINAIASQLDPQRLGQSSEADRGAPIIGPDMIVESGNGRVQAVRRAFEMFPEKAQAYRDYLASLGYDTTGITTPVLVRERVTQMTQDERIAFVQEANQAATMALTPVERAKIDVAAMTDGVIDVWRGGDVGDAQNRDFVSAFIGNLPQTERNGLLDNNARLSPDGSIRIRRALLAAAYDDRELLSELIDSADDNLRGIGNALFDSAAPWLQMRRMARDGTIDPAYDTTVQLVQAARTVSQLRKQRQSVADWLTQEDLTAPRNDVVDAFVRGFYNEKLTRAVGREAINDVIQNYVRVAKEQDTTSMFGAPPTPVELARGAVELRNETNRGAETAALFDKSESSVGPGPSVQRGRRQAQPGALQGSGQGSDRQGQGPTLQRAAEPGRSAQGQADEGLRDQAPAGEVNERASGSNRDDAGSNQPSDPRSRQDDGAAKNQRVKGAGSSSQFQEASFTNRRSLFRDAYEDLGLGDADAAELLPPIRQYALLSKALKDKYNLASVGKSDRANIQKSIDQLLDAYRNLRFMTSVLDVPATAIGLDGTLGLVLTSEGQFLGAYFPQGSDGTSLEGVTTNTPTIGLPGRSNSFAHEWGHALDYFILQKHGETLGNLSGFVRKGETLSDKMPDTVADSFKLLMNSLFFDQAEQSGRILDLERRIEAAAAKGIDATKLQAELDRVRSGASQSQTGRSNFYRTSSDFTNNPDYWRKPTEMLARSFEAYVAHKVEAAGGTTEFIAKGDFAYQSDADKRLAMTFPKDADRFNIFRAYDLVFDALRAEGSLGNGPVDTLPTSAGPIDMNALFLPAQEIAPGGWAKMAFTAEKRALRARAIEIKRAESRPADVRSPLKIFTDALRPALETNRGAMLSMEGWYRSAGNAQAADAIWELTKRIANDPGTARQSFQGGYFAEAVALMSRQYMNRLGVISKNNGIDLMTQAELAELTDAMTAIGDEGATASPKIRKAAAELSRLMKDFWYYMDRAGLDVGFIKEQGYLPRMIDAPLVDADPRGFAAAATEVYKIKFEREIERPADASELDETLDEMADRAKGILMPGGDQVMTDFKAARKEMRRLQKALDAANQGGDGDKIASAQAALDEFMDTAMEVFEEAYDAIRDAWSAMSADAYRQNILYGTVDQTLSGGLGASFLKGRELPPEADKLLAAYYIQDPSERISRYVHQGVRKAEFNLRFGAPKGKGESQLSQLIKGLTAAGVRPQDSEFIQTIVNQVTGNDPSGMPGNLAKGLSAFNTTVTMTMLARVVMTSLAEPATVAIQTGRPLDALKSLTMTVREIAGGKNVRERRALMNALGIIANDSADEMISNRLGGSYGDTQNMQRRSAKWYRMSGLTGYTNASRRSSAVLAGRYLLDMANAVNDPEVSAKERGHAKAELMDAGMTEQQLADFTEWAKEFAGRNPTTADVTQENGDLNNMGRIYATMMQRIVDQSIQAPTAIDRPWAANTAYGRIMAGLMSFSMAFQRNVLIKSAKRIDRMAKAEGVTEAAKYAAFRIAPSFAALYTTHLLATVLREALLNPGKWEEEEEREGGFPVLWLSKLTFSRAGFFGMGDPIFNAIEAVKYQRDFSNIMVGASISYVAQNIDRLIKYFKQNSDKTNNGERQAVKALYELGLPATAYAISGLPAGPLVGYGLGAVSAWLSSPAQKDFVQDVVAGPKEGKAKNSKSGEKKGDNQGGGFR